SRRPLSRAIAFLGAAGLMLGLGTALAGPSSAAIAPSNIASSNIASAVTPATSTAAKRATSVRVSSLAMTGTTTSVTVRRIHRSGQAQWVSHVLDTRLVDLDGCQADRTRTVRNGSTYRAVVHSVCADGPARSEAAARALVADRPWYQVRVTHLPLVGFSLGADLPSGTEKAAQAALSTLPRSAFTFSENDDLSLSYVGQGVTQADLDAAVAAFAARLRISTDKVEVTPLTQGS
ncbi:MAG: hypothetical protein QG622_2591, partial [Actinomycetota bacterium]|nr:hypothetical protein [Actinomycetota bacterium]